MNNLKKTQKTIFDYFSDREINSLIDKSIEFIRKGFSQKIILENLKKDLKKKNIEEHILSEIADIALARIKSKEKVIPDYFFLNKNDLRFATNWLVANYRAKRLKCDAIIDLCSGVGIQSLTFAKTCQNVHSVEIDSRKIKYAKKNVELEKVSNVHFYSQDILDEDLVSEFKKLKINIVFCDPDRAVEENEREIENIKPNVKKMIENYSPITRNIAIELPPQIKKEKIKFDCEKEYVSINGDLNRLTIYLGDLKKCSASAVSLPSGTRIESNENIKIKILYSSLLSYLYEIDRTVLKAELVNELLGQVKEKIYFINGSELLTSEKRIENAFLKTYKIIEKCNIFEETIETLKKEDCGKVILKMKIKPELYWKERKKYESKLRGDKKLYLFFIDERYVICELC